MDNKIMSPAEKGKLALKVLKENCQNAKQLSEDLIMKILDDNKDTEYGKINHFKDIKSIEEFKRTVPFSNYDTYAPAIERMINGEKNLITTSPIVHYALTSGSIGVPKKIPVSAYTLQLYAEYTSNIATALIDKYIQEKEGRPMKNGKRLLSAVVSQKQTPDGTSVGSISGRMYDKARPIMEKVVASPAKVLYSSKKMNFKYLKVFYALKEPNITCMAAPFTTAVYDLLHYIELNWKTLCDDIEKGILSMEVEIPEEERAEFQSALEPDPQRAAELRKIFSEGFDTPIVKKIWPNMEYINAIGAGGFKAYTDKLRKYTGEIPMTFGNYGASEALMAVVTKVESMEYTLIPQGGFYEFIPVDESLNDEKSLMTRTKNLNELEVGQDYELVLTNTSGFYRYRIGDVITVVGYEGESPKICFHYRKSQMISIAGEKTNEESVSYAVQKFSQESGVDVMDFSVYADTDCEPGRYVVLLEPLTHQSRENYEKNCKILDKYMGQANPSYGAKVKDGILSPIRIAYVEPETYALYRDMMLYKGVSENQIKPVRVIDNPRKKKFFFGLLSQED